MSPTLKTAGRLRHQVGLTQCIFSLSDCLRKLNASHHLAHCLFGAPHHHRSLVSFFTELPVVLNKLRPWLSGVAPNADAVDSALQLREWQETLVSLTHLANKYKASSSCDHAKVFCDVCCKLGVHRTKKQLTATPHIHVCCSCPCCAAYPVKPLDALT